MPANLWLRYFPEVPGADLDASELKKQTELRRDLAELGQLVAGTLKPSDVLASSHALHVRWHTLPERVRRWLDGDHGRDTQHLPQAVLSCLAFHVHFWLLSRCPPEPDALHVRTRLESRRLHIRPHGQTPLTPMRSLKSDKIGKLVTVVGTVVRVSALRPVIDQMGFRCARCKREFMQPLPDGKFSPPASCPGCRAKALVPMRHGAATRDLQKVRLQELPDEGASSSASAGERGGDADFFGRVPRTVEVELLDELADCCVPGDALKVCGIVKSVEVAAEGAGAFRGAASNKPRCMYLLYIEAVSAENTKAHAGGGTDAGGERADAGLALSAADLHGIADVAAEPNLLQLLSHSLCPPIFGHEVVKAGLILGLFGGTHRGVTDPQQAVGSRADVHVLVVGDPGMGKSQMLTATAALAPRGVYVCGNTTSSSGLTVTVVKDAATGDFALEAGALVMGDQGCCCIDEFDKMSGGEQQALLEAMEQQSISVAKAGIVCSLSARTAVLAAANPVGGHYSNAKTTAENLKLPPNILSRFDLIFVLLDRPNVHMDELLSAHVIHLHSGTARGGARAAIASGSSRFDGQEGYDQWRRKQEPLATRLRTGVAQLDPVPAALLRKYIAYARQHVHPKLSDAARGVLCTFYIELRKSHQGGDSVPITTRQLESLIRIAEARARLELRVEVTAGDAHDAIEVVKDTIFFDEIASLMGGAAAPTRGRGFGTARASSKRVITRYVKALNEEAESRGEPHFTTDELRACFERTGEQNPRASFADLIEQLNLENYILKKGPGRYKLQTSAVSQRR
jgi:DNA helicase MCM8